MRSSIAHKLSKCVSVGIVTITLKTHAYSGIILNWRNNTDIYKSLAKQIEPQAWWRYKYSQFQYGQIKCEFEVDFHGWSNDFLTFGTIVVNVCRNMGFCSDEINSNIKQVQHQWINTQTNQTFCWWILSEKFAFHTLDFESIWCTRGFHSKWIRFTPCHHLSYQIQNTIKRTDKKNANVNSVHTIQLCSHRNRNRAIFFLLSWPGVIAYKFIVPDIYMCFNSFFKATVVFAYFFYLFFSEPEKKCAHDLTYGKYNRKTNNDFIFWVVIIVSVSVSKSFTLVMNDKPQFISK